MPSVATRKMNSSKSANIPIVVMSAQHRLKTTSLTLPVDDWLPKPFDLEHLYKVVARWVTVR